MSDSKRQRYLLRIDKRKENTIVSLPEFPSLHIEYLRVENTLCPSQYNTSIRCVQEGHLRVTLRVNNERITLDDHDARLKKDSHAGGHVFIGESAYVEDHSRDKTYLVFSVYPEEINTVAKREINMNQPFLLEFEENRTTGYTWKLDLPPDVDILIDTFTQPLDPSQRDGMPGTRTFVLHATSRGTKKVHAIYERPWENDNAASKKEYFYEIL